MPAPTCRASRRSPTGFPPGDASRSVTLYTSSFSVGVGLSFLVSQLVADSFGWRAAFLVTGLGPLLMLAACLMLAPFRPQPSPGHLLDFRPVFRNRAALGYILGYGAHCFELYGMRTWIVAFWTFVALAATARVPLGPIALSVIVTVLSLPASILGNEAALRYGRHRAITVMMLSPPRSRSPSASAHAPSLLVLLLVVAYGFTVPADSGALTSGMSASAVPAQRGATMALHSTVGFGSPRSAPGRRGRARSGRRSRQPDRLAHGICRAGGGSLLGPLALWWSRKTA